jgi:cysteinyl-tRNA synthetase
MKLYNTLTRTIEEVVPIDSPEVKVYTCGPTVYDYAHIGHWFNYIRMDTLIRTIKMAGLQPNWVMNITDVGHLVSDADEGEDKLEKGARREGKTAWGVAAFYTADFLAGMEELRILEPTHLVKATEHIPQQIALIRRLEEKGFTYSIDDGVYYDTRKFPRYADFARLDLDEQQEGARVTINKQKHNQSDFALWKFSPKDHQRDMEWDSPWGKGFPGWHIECSAMSMYYLGETLDIHTGGIDHIPVHHTNEIAQSEGATDKRLSNMWLHSNHVMVNGEKISKSLGNGIRLQEITEKGISPMAIRLNVLESHYRTQSKFSWDTLEAAQRRLQRWLEAADQRWQVLELSDRNHEHVKLAHAAVHDFRAALENDLNTAQALSSIESVVGTIEQYGITAPLLDDFTKLLHLIDDALGINLLRGDISESQKQMITEREKARAKKEWAKSDQLRGTLKEQGVGIRDTDSRTIWYHL